MYGLKADIDLSFFMGRELTQVAVGSYNVQLHFHGPMPSDLSVAQSVVSLSVQGRLEHSSKGSVKEWDGDENMPLSAASLLGLIGSSVVSVQGDPDGTLTLGFSNQEVLVLYDDSSHYESYTIRHDDDLFIV